MNISYIIESVINEYVDEIGLYHGTSADDFDEFDFAFMSSGWGQQAHGYGFYLTDTYECAKEYSKGGRVMRVEIPDGRYLNSKSISKAEAMKIARKFFKYYMTEDEYGREAYKGHENDFWQQECRYIGECYDGESVYGTISSLIGSDKMTSEFLNRLGYVGLIVYDEDSYANKTICNYVIFSPKDIKIIDKNVSKAI